FRHAVHQMQQHPAALDMAEEAVADADALRRALDEAGNIRQHELARLVAHHAKLRLQGGEGVIPHLRPGVGDGVDEGALARVGQAEQPGVRDQLQAQPHPHLLPRIAGDEPARRLIRRTLEVGVALAAVPAAQQHHALARLRQVGDHVLLVFREHLRARRHLQDHVLPARAGAVAAHAVMAALGAEMLGVAVIDQRVQAIDAFDDDIAALAAVAAVRPAELDELLTPERHAAVAAVARLEVNLPLIQKLHAACISTWLALWASQPSRVNATFRQGTLQSRAGPPRPPSAAGAKPSFSSTRPDAGLSVKQPATTRGSRSPRNASSSTAPAASVA